MHTYTYIYIYKYSKYKTPDLPVRKPCGLGSMRTQYTDTKCPGNPTMTFSSLASGGSLDFSDVFHVFAGVTIKTSFQEELYISRF